MDEENRILNGESLDDMEIVRWDGPGGRRWPSALGMPPAPHSEEEEPLPAEPVPEGSDPADVTEATPEELPAGVPAAESVRIPLHPDRKHRNSSQAAAIFHFFMNSSMICAFLPVR